MSAIAVGAPLMGEAISYPFLAIHLVDYTVLWCDLSQVYSAHTLLTFTSRFTSRFTLLSAQGGVVCLRCGSPAVYHLRAGGDSAGGATGPIISSFFCDFQ